MPASMSSLYPDWFVPAVILVGVTQLAFALLAFKTSRVLSCAFVVLTGSQILAAVYIVTAPSHVPGAADLGGANLGPAIVFFFAFWVSVLVWVISAVVGAITFLTKRTR